MNGTQAYAVPSEDGTPIGFVKSGTGPAIVFVHGSLTTGSQWLPVASELSDRFTCYLIDRRGRGSSGDSADYSLTRECEDIEAVLRVAGPAACLLGHSYGAICALESARRHPVSKLILYEPPLPILERVIGPAFDDFRSAVARGDLDGALTIGLRGMVRVAPAEIERLKLSPAWSGMVALTPTWVRECEVLSRLELGVSRYREMSAPTLLLLGTATAAHHMEASRALAATLPAARSVEFAGHSHFAHLTATDQVASAVADFIADGHLLLGREPAAPSS